jgi:hypothetical protein
MPCSRWNNDFSLHNDVGLNSTTIHIHFDYNNEAVHAVELPVLVFRLINSNMIQSLVMIVSTAFKSQ